MCQASGAPGRGRQFLARLFGLHPRASERDQRVLRAARAPAGRRDRSADAARDRRRAARPRRRPGAAAGAARDGSARERRPAVAAACGRSRRDRRGAVSRAVRSHAGRATPGRRAIGAAGSTACAAGDRAPGGSRSTGGPSARLRARGPAPDTGRPCGPAYRRRRRGSGGGGGTGRWLRSVHPTTAGAAGIAAGAAGGGCGGEAAAAGDVRGERRDLLAKVRLLALRARSGCRPFRTMASKRWPQWSQRYSKMGTMGPL